PPVYRTGGHVTAEVRREPPTRIGCAAARLHRSNGRAGRGRRGLLRPAVLLHPLPQEVQPEPGGLPSACVDERLKTIENASKAELERLFPGTVEGVLGQRGRRRIVSGRHRAFEDGVLLRP